MKLFWAKIKRCFFAIKPIPVNTFARRSNMGFWKKWWEGSVENGDGEMPELMPEPPKDWAPQELKDAEKRCPDVKFVQSCRSFYEKRGFLSNAQLDALRYSGTPNRRKRQFWRNEPLTQDEDNPFDPDRD